MRAMILAAGKGTRLQPLTFDKPKALIEVNQKPLLQYAIEHLKQHGITDIIINIHHLGDQVMRFIEQNDSFGLHIEFSDERGQLMDTGGGLVKAAPFFNDQEPFFLYAGDIITNVNLADVNEYHRKYKPLATLAVKDRPTSRRLLFDKQNVLCGWKNNQTQETKMARRSDQYQSLGFSGIHLIDPRIFGLFEETGAFSITDAYIRLAKHHTIMGFRHDDNPWYEFGRYEKLKQTEQEIIKSGFSLLNNE